MFFDLTEDQVIQLLREQGYRCALSGIEFRADAAKGCFRAPYRPSIDRIDCELGYTLCNVRLVLVAVNIALSDWGEDVLFDIAEAIANTNRRLHGP